MRRIRRASRAVVGVVCAATVTASSAQANGWEHGAIPFGALLHALESPAPAMRMRAAESLGFRGQRQGVDPILLLVAGGEPRDEVRAAAYRALGRLGDPRALPALTVCLTEEPRERVRTACAVALGEIGVPDAAAPLLSALEDEAQDVRLAAVTGLGTYGTPAVVTRLAELARRGDEGEAVSLRAIQSLGRTGVDDAIAPLLDVLQQTPDVAQQAATVQALGRLKAKAAVSLLTGLLGPDSDPRLRLPVTVALGAIRDADALPSLVALLDDPEPSVRFFAVRGLAELGRREAVPALLARYQATSDVVDAPPDADATRRSKAQTSMQRVAALALQVETVEALTDLDASAAKDALLDAARPRPTARASAADLRIASGIYELRRSAIYGLGYTQSQDASDLLAGPAGLGDPDPRLRAAAVRSLGVLGFENTAAAVRPMLGDPSPEVRWTAAMVLGRVGDGDAVPLLIARLEDPYAEVRRQAALALGYIGDPLAADALAKADTDPSEGVRSAATHAAALLRNE